MKWTLKVVLSALMKLGANEEVQIREQKGCRNGLMLGSWKINVTVDS